MATEWLMKQTSLNKKLQNKNHQFQETITYHDPCHARKVLGVYKEPRELISNNYAIKEMSNSNVCCGFGGVTMQTENYHLAKQSGKRKADIIINANADIVAAECSACRMQITNSLYQERSKVTFKHPIELIGQALEA